ncbi:hypothetical protein [Streptomyces sp. NPDC005244]|uniref:hypothetical protein n=1 Tax=Streptomyces sp. NPDC005244 TaxID=3364708 RepID=UPI003682A3D1
MTYACKKVPPSGTGCVHEACRPEGPISEEVKRVGQREVTMHDVINEEAPGPADPLPRYTADVSFAFEGGQPWAISVHGPAAFVAHVVSSAADAFEEDAQR